METTTRTRCEGSGKPGSVGLPGILYPHCPDCGREFSAQGRKANARMGNAWKRIPNHYYRGSR